MATKLNIGTGGNHVGNKIVDIHQKNEYTKINNYKEGLCFGCLKNDAVGALVIDVCGDCAGKRCRETLLVSIKGVYYGLCYLCGDFKFHMEQVNTRLCHSCHRHTALIMKDYNKKGGMMGADPFWIHQRKKNGKDWKHAFSNGTGNSR